MKESIESFFTRQIEWSRRCFGDGKRTFGVTKHMEKEIAEVRENPEDLLEWIDLIMLAMDGYWRHGGTSESLMADLLQKQGMNFLREYPAPTSENEPVEHVR